MMEQLVNWLDSVIWSNALIGVALLSGVYYSIRTRFVQVRMFREMVRLLFVGKGASSGIASFQ